MTDVTPEQAEQRAIGWDEAVDEMKAYVTPYIRRKMKKNNPYREEKTND